MSERQSKNTQDKHERILNDVVKQPGNENCADCGAKNPRWASYSLGVFLCIRCAGIHRKMGTHISKVKSITMDQWTMDQIEVMRNSGGNNSVNSKINPNPGNHPRPLVDDEHAIERYIRAKWEKRLFLARATAHSPPTTTATNPAINRLQVLPKRSSSVPINNGTDPLLVGLNQLRDMGFKDELKNKQVLIQTQGKLDAAVEILTRSSQPPLVQQQQGSFAMTDEQKNEQLMKLGFLDKQQNLDALRRSGGNLDIAMTILNETKNLALAGQVNQFRSNSVPTIPSLAPATTITTTTSSNLLIDVDSGNSMTMNNLQTANPFAMNNNNMQQQFQQLQQQQMLQQQQQSTIFNNPFGLSTIPTTTNASVFNNQQLVSTPSAFQTNNNFQTQLTPNTFPTTQQQTLNPFSQMTTTNNTTPYTTTSTPSYFNQPLSSQPQPVQPFGTFGMTTQQQLPPFTTQQQAQQHFGTTTNPWTPSNGGSSLF